MKVKSTFGILYLNSKCQYTNIYETGKTIKPFDTVKEAKAYIDQLRKDKTHEINLVHKVCIAKYEGKQLIGVVERY